MDWKDRLLNVITLGEHEHPGSLKQYAKGEAESFDPRTPAGFLNALSMVIPGGKTAAGPRHLGLFAEEQAAKQAPVDRYHATLQAIKENKSGRWYVQGLPNGYDLVHDRASGLQTLYDPKTGMRHGGGSDILPALEQLTTKASRNEMIKAVQKKYGP